MKHLTVILLCLLSALPTAHAQTRNLNVEVRALDINKASLKELGVAWEVTIGRPTYPQIGRIGRDISVAAELRALEAKKSVRTHTIARTLTLTGKPALLFVGQQHPFYVDRYDGFGGFSRTLQFVDFGVRLVALPELQEDGTIKLALRFDTSTLEPPPLRPGAGSVFPLFKARRSEATVVLKDGEPLLLGQFYSHEERRQLSGVPGISKVPIFGALFSRSTRERDQNEFVLFVTVTSQ